MIPEQRREEFAKLYDEFSTAYLKTAKGREHNEAYRSSRAPAAKNLAAVRAMLEREEDATDLILNGLLPHANTKHNRERGAWIHVAPAITKDLQMGGEG